MFTVDNQIQSSSFNLGSWPLSEVFLKNDRNYPWFILVPRVLEVQELWQLEKQDRQLLMEEINQLSILVNNQFNPDKLNVGALGNIVKQLHIHVVARKASDALWPHGIWQSALINDPYREQGLEEFLQGLRAQIVSRVFEIQQ